MTTLIISALALLCAILLGLCLRLSDSARFWRRSSDDYRALWCRSWTCSAALRRELEKREHREGVYR